MLQAYESPTILLKRGVAKIPHPLLMRSYHIWWQLRHQRRMLKLRRESNAPLLELDQIIQRKSSDTLFILGSGGSINQISQERWGAIRRCDSFGFNFWLLHKHVPTFFTIEDTDHPVFFEAARRQDYVDVPKILTAIDPRDLISFHKRLPSHWHENLWIAPITPVLARTQQELKNSIQYLDSKQYFDPQGPSSLFKYRATLNMVIGLGARLGYKRLILCGIDLNRADYFYENRALYPQHQGFRSSRPGKVHATYERRDNVMAADEIVVELDRTILRPRGVELYAENPTSALVPRVPATTDALYEELLSE